MVRFTGAVLAGGASRRLGRDKAFVEVGGRPLVAVAVDALLGAGAAEVLAVGGDGGRLGRLPGVVPVADDHPGDGPLGGILTALRHAACDVVAVLSCDLPAVSPDAVRAVIAGLDAAQAAGAALAVAGGRRQPLVAAYRRQAEGALRRSFATGERSPAAAVSGLTVVDVPLRDERWAHGVNTPAELAEARDASDTRQTGPMPPNRTVPEIDVPELARRHAEGAWILDVRRPDEYAAGHVPGARLIPLDQLSTRADEVPKDRPVLVICATGNRSATAVEALLAAGWDATNVAGGTKGWIAAGHPVVEGTDER